MEWIRKRIRLGYVDVVNPFNKKQVSRVSLDPGDVKCWVWWSKNFKEWIALYKENPKLFTQYEGHSFQFTINSPSAMERTLNISLKERISQLEWLVNEFGTLAVSYRYDPIMLYIEKASGQIIGNLEKFEWIIEKVASLGLKEMIISFATIYKKVDRRMRKRGKIPLDLTLKKKKEILSKLLEVCESFGVKIKACCQPELLDLDGIEQSHCIDANKIEKIVGERMSKAQDAGQRDACGCHKSRDIGGYTGRFRCKHNCDYCYANPSRE